MGNRKKTGMSVAVWALLFAGWLTLVFTFSSQSYEQQSIQPFLREHIEFHQLVRWLPDMTITYNSSRIHSHSNPYHFVEFFFRKGAHVFVYAMLAGILFMLLRSFNKKRWLRAMLLTLVAAIIVPSLDEWNQLQSPNRTGNATDVWLDFAGGCLGLLVCFILLGLRKLWRKR